MSDLFSDKARDWDSRPVPAQISEGVSRALIDAIPLSPALSVMDFGAGTGLVSSKLAAHVGHILAVDVSAAMLEQAGFGDVRFVTACEVHKDGRAYPVFLVTATKQ